MIQDNVLAVSFRWTVDELITAHTMQEKVYLESKPKRFFYNPILTSIFIGFFGLVVLVNLILVIVQGKGNPVNIFVFVSVLIVAGKYCSRRLFMKRYYRRHYEKRPDRDKMVHYIIDEHSIKSKTEDLSESNNQWSGYVKVARTPLGFLLYPNDQLFNWIPDHAFSSMEEANWLEELARNKVKFIKLK